MKPQLPILGVLGLVLLSAFALMAQNRTDNPHGATVADCAECHTSDRWTPLKQPLAFQHDKTGFRLEAGHASVACRSCHQSLVFSQIGTQCLDCHKDVHRGELGVHCAACHTARTWTNQTEIFRVHSKTRFPLFAAHANLDCASCHKNQTPLEYKGTPTTCGACHAQTYVQTKNPPHVQSGFPRQCEGCHKATSLRWQEATFRHDSYPLRGAHVAALCADCHKGNVYKGTTRQCGGCHAADFSGAKSPDHAAAGFPMQCEACHSVNAWQPAAFPDHAKTGFPLTGAHVSVACASCHVGGRFAGTPTDCYSCHKTDFTGTTAPNHVQSNFPTQCLSCHTTAAWKPANFDHSKTGFPLTGAHTSLECAKCHANGKFAGTPKDCYSCHQADYSGAANPNHVQANFPTQCQTCHTTSAWKPASFNHNQTGFALTGAHARLDCSACHKNGQFGKLPTDCYSCHSADFNRANNPNHSGFPTQCTICHTTSAWQPASFDHNRTGFPLTGAHAGLNCNACHTGGQFTRLPTDCYSCHAADYNGTTDPNHRAEGFPTQCQQCHNTSSWHDAGGGANKWRRLHPRP